MDELGRVMMTISCRDCDALPKVAEAGRIVVQVMHNGLRVVAGGYHGDWMAHVIRALRGHHEPQEEAVFATLVRCARHNSLIVELGAFWSYYSLWYLSEVPGSRAICVEPDPRHIEVGRRNAALNGLDHRARFVEAWVGASDTGVAALPLESTGEMRSLPSLDMTAVAEMAGSSGIEVRHIDAQGAETSFLRSIAAAPARPRFLVASTHHRLISGSASTHADCLAAIEAAGGHVLIEHSVEESFSGDGLIVASFREQDRSIAMPPMSRNWAEHSLFPEP